MDPEMANRPVGEHIEATAIPLIPIQLPQLFQHKGLNKD
jgi:hypothetical protein